MDLLVSGADDDAARWQPPVAVVAVLALLAALAGVAAAVRLSPGDVFVAQTQRGGGQRLMPHEVHLDALFAACRSG